MRQRSRTAGLLALTAALLALALTWVWAAHALWHSSVPSDLRLPHVDPRSLFGARFLRRSASYERLLDVDHAFGEVALLVTLALYARHGQRLMRESAAGRIGTGMLLGMLGFAIVWLVELPFELVGVWWERRHGISHQGYASAVFGGFFGLGAQFLSICLVLAVVMLLARVSRRWWWLVAAPLFAALTLLITYFSIYLASATHPLHDPRTLADVRRLARREGIPGTHAVVQVVNRQTTAPDAESVGFGSTRRVILWDTLLDGRFDNAEVSVVIGHELGHLAHDHPAKRVGWLLLFLLPATALVALATGRRGGLARPEAVPVAVFVFVLLQLLATPALNVVYRRQEAEADWSALRATHDPRAARSLFVKLATTSLADPDPPTWSYVLDDNHPTIVQRVAMVQAWERRGAGG